MQEIAVKKILKKNSVTEVQLDGNRNVAAVKVKLSNTVSGLVTIKCAQNNVFTDLISFAETELNEEAEKEISVKIPVAASHLFIYFTDMDAFVQDICVYEQESSDSNNFYPLVKDIELEKNYYLDTISIFTAEKGYSHYSIYTSMDGRDFDFLARKNDSEICNTETGDIYNAQKREARFIRLYMEYYSESPETMINDIRFTGQKSGTPIKKRPDIYIPSFESSEYNVNITTADTYEEVYGIIERQLGKEYMSWFALKIEKNPICGHEYDYFKLEYTENKICITANSGVSLAVGLNHYLKYYCRVHISQVGNQVKMPSEIVPFEKTVFRETKAKVRYAYNYCTFSYSMAFWGEKEWRNELDWLALNGVNAVLDLTAQEEVWRRFLKSLGYSHEEAKRYIAGPAYYAWAYMGNLFGFGGPVHDSWFEERTELARRNQLIMRRLGMYPVLQGYSGMVPIDIEKYDSDVQVIPQGMWCSFTRPHMLQTTSDSFKKYADKFYKAQKEVYGTYSNYFAIDPFHEGGNTSGMSLRSISREVLSAMIRANRNAVWVIQSWQQNPASELLAGLDDIENGKEHALILDLYAEKLPNYDKGAKGNEAHGYSREFDNTPWIFCMLNNFGGRLGMYGHMDNLAELIPDAYNTCCKIAGIGITPEASVNNPVLYDFLFECIWQADANQKMEKINLRKWLHEYSVRRYGAESKSVQKAWDILKETVYKSELNNLGQGAPESVLNARPSLHVTSASAWGNAVISYDKKELEKAARLLLEDYEILKESSGYKYDVATILQQVLSNRAQDYYNGMVKAFSDKDISEFDKYAEKFLDTADNMEAVLSISEYYMLGRWLEQAKALAENADDFSKMLYEFNAKSLITTWGAYNQSEIGLLHDYSNRQWSGLIKSFYKLRWEMWIENCRAELEGKVYEEDIDWFEWEWNWVRSDECYPAEPQKTDLLSLGKKVLK